MRWTLKPISPLEKILKLSNALGVDKTIASLLLQRGVENYEQAKAFFRPSLDDLHDPYLMKDMEKAVNRIETAIKRNENIMVYGDYDVDGTSSVALMASFLNTYYPNITTYIPDRYNEGYGVSYQGIDYAWDNDITLIIALDCGIKAIEKIDYAHSKGIDFIICDHHRPGATIPNAVAVLDPKRKDCTYPYDELCGCGVGFKLVQALAAKRGLTTSDLVEYLDLVATAIGADIVPITGENRILAFYGLRVINSNPRPGFKAIIEQINKEQLEIHDVVFIIAPRINAAGRMKHGIHAVNLMTETDIDKARIFAQEIDNYNLERKDTDKQTTEEALAQIQNNKETKNFTTVVMQENWHKGVIGIVASRLTETHYRPTLVFTKSGDKLAASARSVKGFDIYEALESCKEHIEQFGGHKYAAGLTLPLDQYQPFKDKFEDVVKNTIDPKQLIPELEIDLEVDFSEITPKFFRILKQFAPFGPGNMTPVFMTQNVRDYNGWSKQVGENKDHLRIVAAQSESSFFTGIGFGLGEHFSIIDSGKPFKLAYSLEENRWNGNVSIQLRLRDIKPY